MGFASRLPNSNDPPSGKLRNPWGPQSDVLDETAVLLNSLGKRCHECKRVVMNKHLRPHGEKYYCPDHDPKAK